MALAVTWEPLTPNYVCIHSPLDSNEALFAAGSLPVTSCQAELCWEPTKLSTQPLD